MVSITFLGWQPVLTWAFPAVFSGEWECLGYICWSHSTWNTRVDSWKMSFLSGRLPGMGYLGFTWEVKGVVQMCREAGCQHCTYQMDWIRKIRPSKDPSQMCWGFQTQVSSLCNMGEFGQNRLQQVIFRFDGAQNGVVGRGFNGMWETKELDLFFSLPWLFLGRKCFMECRMGQL